MEAMFALLQEEKKEGVDPETATTVPPSTHQYAPTAHSIINVAAGIILGALSLVLFFYSPRPVPSTYLGCDPARTVTWPQGWCVTNTEPYAFVDEVELPYTPAMAWAHEEMRARGNRALRFTIAFFLGSAVWAHVIVFKCSRRTQPRPTPLQTPQQP